MSLQDVITKIRNREGNSGAHWLFINGDPDDLGLETDCALGVIEVDEEADPLKEIIPAGFHERGLHSTIEYQTLVDCVEWADRLAGRSDDEAAAEIIRYYLRFDAWPDQLGAPDPPPWEETVARLDREFFDSLGPERAGTTCRRDDCSRGAVTLSAFCARHHFENLKKKPCPF